MIALTYVCIMQVGVHLHKKYATVPILKNLKHAQVSRSMHSGICPAISTILEKEHHPQTLQSMV